MEETLDERLAFWREIITDRITTTGQVCTTPCFVFAVSVEATAGGSVIDAHLYDGHNVTDKEKITFTAQYSHPTFTPVVPMFFRKGIYAYLQTNVASITIMYLSIRE